MSGTTPKNLVSRIWTQPFDSPHSCPESADIVIIGGGIIGVSTAWFLAKQGINVVLCEKGHIAGEQSGRNWGWVRQQGRDTREMPMIVESLRIWRGLEEEIGEDVGFAETGCLFAARTNKQLDECADWVKTAAEFGLDTRVISADEFQQHVQSSPGTWCGALYTASDGRAEPHKAVPAIARAAAREGATMLTSCAVRGLESSSGRVSAVVTEHGLIKTSVVLCAAGAWTSMFCRSIGIAVPQLKVRGTVTRTAPAANVANGCLFDDKIAIRRRQDGGYTAVNGMLLDHAITPSTFRYGAKFLRAFMLDPAGMRLSIGREFVEEWNTPSTWDVAAETVFERTRVLDPEPNPNIVKSIKTNLESVFPQLAGIDIVESWAGMIEATPDAIPVIDEAENYEGFFIATGFSGHGFGIGPGAAKAITGMLTGNDSGIDLREFRLSRFFDGTPIRPQSSV
jgi:glycine/D-amino acid oxidase-like deaminating enzyme